MRVDSDRKAVLGWRYPDAEFHRTQRRFLVPDNQEPIASLDLLILSLLGQLSRYITKLRLILEKHGVNPSLL
ncbi:TPA: hypothetical protein DD455_04530 [Candidatus Shapirobacteria bacterium]|nr:hypothetical protein [Candidatus Shapirobacteria bacterium]